MLHPEPGEQGVRREPPDREGEQQHVQQLGGGHRVTAAVPAHLRSEAVFREDTVVVVNIQWFNIHCSVYCDICE